MSRSLILALNEFNANVQRARRAYETDPFVYSDLLDTPCNACKVNQHSRCTNRVAIGKSRVITCGCRELGHPRQEDSA